MTDRGRVSLGIAALVVLATSIGCSAVIAPSASPASPGPSASVSSGPLLSAASQAAPSIADALRDGHVVALGEWHGQAAEHHFFTQVLADPQVRANLDTVVVEWGAAPQQDIVDRFVAGDDVPEADLRKIWTTTTQQSGVWDSLLYRQFFESVRAMNAADQAHPLRVILGDPGNEATLCEQVDLVTCTDRDAFMADRIAAERKAGHDVLLLAGVFHVWRPADGEPGVTKRLDAMGIASYVLLPFGGPLLRDTAVREHLTDAAPGSSRVTGWRPRGRASCAAASRSIAIIRRATRPAMSARCRMWPMASSTSAHKCQVPVAEVASVARRALATTPLQKSTAPRS